jgi:hypothetical protein
MLHKYSFSFAFPVLDRRIHCVSRETTFLAEARSRNGILSEAEARQPVLSRGARVSRACQPVPEARRTPSTARLARLIAAARRLKSLTDAHLTALAGRSARRAGAASRERSCAPPWDGWLGYPEYANRDPSLPPLPNQKHPDIYGSGARRAPSATRPRPTAWSAGRRQSAERVFQCGSCCWPWARSRTRCLGGEDGASVLAVSGTASGAALLARAPS